MIQNIPFLNHLRSDRFFLLAGPCVIENDTNPFQIAEELSKICQDVDVPFVFKGSYRKANRTRLDSFSGIGDLKALRILRRISETFQIPVVTDIHQPDEAQLAAEFVDVLQIPAFLCRQTDLLVAAANTGKTVNIKKGQFLSGSSMKFAVDKVLQSGNDKIMLTDRGNMFGYNDLVVDFRNIPEMQQFGVPVIMDITHSLQQPNQSSGVTGGQPQMISIIGSSAIASGADGIFMETHPDPASALSDGANMLPLSMVKDLIYRLVRIREAIS